MPLIIILIGIFIPIIILSIISTFYVSYIERSRTIKKLRKNLSYFSCQTLSHRLYAFENEMANNEAYKGLIKSFKEVDRDKKLIDKSLVDLDKLNTPASLIGNAKFKKLLKNTFKEVSDYQDEFLRIRFSLLDLTSDIEVEKVVIKELQKISVEATNLYSNSPIPRIRESKLIEGKLISIRKMLKEIQHLVENEGIHLSNEFIKREEAIKDAIIDFKKSIILMADNIKHIDEELDFSMKSSAKLYRKNMPILGDLEEVVKTTASKYVKYKKQTNVFIDSLDFNKVDLAMKELNAIVYDFSFLINSNIHYAKFNNMYDYIPPMLTEFVAKNHGLFTSEIKRHVLNNETERLLFVEKAEEKFMASSLKYEKVKSSPNNEMTPSKIHELFMKTIDQFETYTRVAFENVKDISVVNSSTNEMNDKIANMNLLLLQIEHNISTMEGATRNDFEKKKENIQLKVQRLREHFQENTKAITKEGFEAVEKLENKINSLVSQTRGVSFSIYFLQETILYINKFKGENDRIDPLIDSMQDSFKNERYIESLRKAKEIIDIYGIK